jgi:lipid II:glycine glycyltransferase (peptidoglycan interpeptide bridge formation enzyme)
MIDLENRLPSTERRKRSLRKALAAKVSVLEDPSLIPELWDVLIENLKTKHKATPVHSLREIQTLLRRFPLNIRCLTAKIENRVVAGVILFDTPTALHAQYIASNELGQNASALDAVFSEAIAIAVAERKRWFDFGTSNEENGWKLNSGLYKFKSEFGGGGAVHEVYEIEL